MKRVFILCILLSTFLSSWAYDFEVNGIYYNLLSKTDLTCEVAESPNKDYSGSVVIPSQVLYGGKMLSVISIGKDAFHKCTDLTSISIPSSVTNIGTRAFSGCSALTSVTLPNFISSIGCYTFYDCKSLTSIYIPNSVTNIDEGAFSSCSALTSISIPSSVTNIGRYAFSYCSNLTSVMFNAKRCETMGNGEAFYKCENLKTVIIGDEVELIPSRAFQGCSGLKSVSIGNKVERIGDRAFWNCDKLESVTMGNNVLILGNEVFSICTSLSSIILPNSVTHIGNDVFWNCGLKSVTIGNSVKNIGEDAFSGCEELKEIKCLSPIPPVCGANTFNRVSKTECAIIVPDESVDIYSKSNGWKDFWNFNVICAKPTISLVDGQLVIESATIGSTCKTTITSADMKTTENNVIELTGVYTISSYAWRQGDIDSETATATLIWVNPTIDATSVMSMEMKKALLLRSAGSGIAVEGMNEGETIDLYSINGQLLDKVAAQTESTTIGTALRKGQIYIIKVGDRSVKFRY